MNQQILADISMNSFEQWSFYQHKCVLPTSFGGISCENLQWGMVTEHDMKMVKTLCLGQDDIHPPDFSQQPWNSCSLVTPRHVVGIGCSRVSGIPMYSSQVPVGKPVKPVLVGIRYLVPENPKSPGINSGKLRYLWQVPVFSSFQYGHDISRKIVFFSLN